MNTVIDEIKNNQIVAIIRADSTETLEHTVESLYKGGVRIVEVTMNTPGALKGIERIRNLYPELVIGAGTVLDPESARLAILSGASFLLAPTLKESTISVANRYNTPIIPGVLTPTEALTAYEYGAKMVKIFPVRSLGPSYISDLKEPLSQLDIMAVGGISLSNAQGFLNAGTCSLGVGSSLVDNKLIAKGDYAEIETRAKAFVEIVNRFKSPNSI